MVKYVLKYLISHKPLSTAFVFAGSVSSKSKGSSSSVQVLVIIRDNPLCRIKRFPMNAKIISRAFAGPTRERRESLLTNAATIYSGR